MNNILGNQKSYSHKVEFILSGMDTSNQFEVNNIDLLGKPSMFFLNYTNSLELRQDIQNIINTDLVTNGTLGNNSLAEVLIKNTDNFNTLSINDQNLFVYAAFTYQQESINATETPHLHKLILYYLFIKDNQRQACVTFYVHDEENDQSQRNMDVFGDVLIDLLKIHKVSTAFLYKLKNDSLFGTINTNIDPSNDLPEFIPRDNSADSNYKTMILNNINQMDSNNMNFYNNIDLNNQMDNNVTNMMDVDNNEKESEMGMNNEKESEMGTDSYKDEDGMDSDELNSDEMNFTIDEDVLRRLREQTIKSGSKESEILRKLDMDENGEPVPIGLFTILKDDQTKKAALNTLLISNLAEFNNHVNEVIIPIVNNTVTINNVVQEDGIDNNIMDPNNNIYVFNKKIYIDDDEKKYITGLIFYDTFNDYVLFTNMYVLFATDVISEMLKILDLFKCKFDENMTSNEFYLYGVSNVVYDILLESYNGFKYATEEEINMLQNDYFSKYGKILSKENMYNYVLKFSKPAKPIINMNDPFNSIIFPIKNMAIDLNSTFFDIMERNDVKINDYLNSNSNNIIFICNNTFYGSNKDDIRTILLKNNLPNYDELFYECDLSYNIYEDTIYVNLRKLGIPNGYIKVNDIIKILNMSSVSNTASSNNTYYQRIYYLKELEKKIISIISLTTKYAICPNIESRSHCQESQGGNLYDVEIVQITSSPNINQFNSLESRTLKNYKVGGKKYSKTLKKLFKI